MNKVKKRKGLSLVRFDPSNPPHHRRRGRFRSLWDLGQAFDEALRYGLEELLREFAVVNRHLLAVPRDLVQPVGGEIVVATVGSFVIKPRGVYHALCNTATVPVRFLEFHTPGEFDNYYDEYEQIVESAVDEDERRKARAELGERYGVSWHDERIPEARARFGRGP